MAWKTVRADEFCSFVTDGTHDSPKPQSQGRKLITSKHLKGDYIDFDSANWISEGDYQKIIARSAVEQWDILFSMIGTIGTIYLEKNPIVEYACKNMGVFKFAGNAENAFWMYYYLKSPQAKEYIQSHLRGSTQAYVPLGSLREMPVSIPDRETRNRIVSLLKPLDEKIATNRAINDNLQQQAQGILRHFMDQYQYQLNPLSTIADVIDCLHSKKPSAIEGSTYQLIQLDNIRDDGFLDMSVCKYMISQADYENWTRKCEIIEGDCVITNVGRIGAVSQAPYGTRAAMGRNMTCIRLKSGFQLRAYFITVLLSSHMRRQIQHNTDEGTIMGALNVKNIPKLLFPIFAPSIMSDLEAILYPLRKQIEYNNLQNQNLAQLRDTLLPRLMSGELNVSAIEL